MTHVTAIYSGQEVPIDYVPHKANGKPDEKREFNIACMRVLDNAKDGHVRCPNGKIYYVTRANRTAKLVPSVNDK